MLAYTKKVRFTYMNTHNHTHTHTHVDRYRPIY